MLNPGQKHRSFIIRSKWLFPVTHRPLENAWLRVERGVVTGFGVWPPRTVKSIHVIDNGNAIIAPGFVNTEMAQSFIKENGEDFVKKGIQLNRLTEPKDISPVVSLICTGKMDHSTGSTIDINAGSYLR